MALSFVTPVESGALWAGPDGPAHRPPSRAMRIGIILDNLSDSAYDLKTSHRAPTSFIPSTHEAPMSFRVNFLLNREFMSNVLIWHAISRSGSVKRGKSGPILQIPC